jgi:GT2 family glycosyltransferase
VPADQIILLHNGSEKRWVERLQAEFADIEHLVEPTNLGYTGGVNTLLTRAFTQVPWTLLLTNDVQLLEVEIPNRIALVAPLIFRRKIGVVDSLGGRFYPNVGRLEHCRLREDFDRQIAKTKPYVPGTAFWLHREVFTQVGLFDVKLGTYWEDVDYSQRVLGENKTLFACEKTKILHSVGKTCHKKKYYTKYLFSRNKYYVSLKFGYSTLSRLCFRVYYWSEWGGAIIKALCAGDRETLAFKWQIARDIILR